MADDSPDALAARLRTAFDLCARGESMRRAQLRREHPDATDEEIEAMLVALLETRPGADLAVLVAGDRDAEALVRDLQGRGWLVEVARSMWGGA